MKSDQLYTLATELRNIATSLDGVLPPVAGTFHRLCCEVETQINMLEARRLHSLITGESEEAKSYNFARFVKGKSPIDFSYKSPVTEMVSQEDSLLRFNESLVSKWNWIIMNEVKTFPVTFNITNGNKDASVWCSFTSPENIRISFIDKFFTTIINVNDYRVSSKEIVYDYTKETFKLPHHYFIELPDILNRYIEMMIQNSPIKTTVPKQEHHYLITTDQFKENIADILKETMAPHGDYVNIGEEDYDGDKKVTDIQFNMYGGTVDLGEITTYSGDDCKVAYYFRLTHPIFNFPKSSVIIRGVSKNLIAGWFAKEIETHFKNYLNSLYEVMFDLNKHADKENTEA